jgi:hypothetical protein
MTKDEALKLALEALDVVKLHFTQNRHVNEAITAIKEALSQPEQEPVAWADKQSLDQIANFDATIYAKGGFDNATPLYTTPPLPVQPERPWVGLTDEEVVSIEECALTKRIAIVMTAATLKEKNT